MFILIASLLKCVSDFTTDVFFVGKQAFKLNISTKKDTKKDKNINICSLKYDFEKSETLFELINIEVQCSKRFFLQQVQALEIT